MMPVSQPRPPRPEILQTAARRLIENLQIDIGSDEPAQLSEADADAAVNMVVSTLAVEGGLSLTELDRAQAEARAARKLRAALRDLVADIRNLDERLLKQRDETADHKKSLAIERAASHVRAIAESIERILSIEPAPDDGLVLVAKADLVSYLNRGTGDLRTEADVLNRLLMAAGLKE